MGTKPRTKPKRLAEKLLKIRVALGISQPEIVKRLGVEGEITFKQISKYETGLREPTLLILLQYARIAGVSMESLADDKLDLPDKLPSKAKHFRG
jgi:transcriptional regulator with XRE-family HTH domain